jgi:hypothetical protein
VVFNVGGAAIYYGFERLWDAIEWGKKLPVEWGKQIPVLPLDLMEQSN